MFVVFAIGFVLFISVFYDCNSFLLFGTDYLLFRVVCYWFCVWLFDVSSFVSLCFVSCLNCFIV